MNFVMEIVFILIDLMDLTLSHLDLLLVVLMKLYISAIFQMIMKPQFLILIYRSSADEPTIVRKSVGTIDYVKGEILLNPILIQSTSKTFDGEPIIEIAAVPKSNDVIGKQDLYLQLDISKSTLNMKLDEISSGSDTSSSLYNVTTNHTNGSRIRQ